VSLNGAQFASCGTWGWGLAIGGLITSIVGLALHQENPTCHPDYNRPYGCYREHCHNSGPNNEQHCYDRYETCYPTVCDSPGYYPYREAGTITMIAGGVALATGIVLIVLEDNGTCR
jgi:hypothetical protein